MRIAAISDLHIGPTARDAFGHQEDHFLGWLDKLEARHDVIVMLGDIYQTDQAAGFGRASAVNSLLRAQERLRRFFERTRESQYQWVHGNHDREAQEELQAKGEIILGDADFSVLYTHGDQWDPFLSRVPGVSRAATWFAGRLRAIGLRPLAEHLEARDVAIKASRFQGRDGPYVRGALQHLGKVQAVVLGHTHVPFHHQIPEGIVANTGTCSRGHYMGVSVDTSTGEVNALQEVGFLVPRRNRNPA